MVKQENRSRFKKGLVVASRVAVFALLLLLVGLAIWIASPLPKDLLSRDGVVSLQFTDRSGAILREMLSREDGRSVPLSDGKVPSLVRQAFLAAEDHRFFSHPGVDPLAIARAALRNIAKLKIVGGASTITQQLARRLVPHERSFSGKLAEILWALRLSAHLSKEQVLLEYLNRVPLGNTVFGIESAAAHYFGKPASTLSLGQAALLAGMVCSPARYDPFRHIDRARIRESRVLAAMEKLGFVSGEEARIALETSLDLVTPERAFRAPHLIAHMARHLEGGLEEAEKIETTIDPALQSDVEVLMREELSGLVSRRARQAAAIVVDNPTGEVLAYIGSANFSDEERFGQNDGVRALRQPGSALKPFAYGLALSKGYTAATVLSDVETHLSTVTGDYVPKNYDRRIHGPVRLRAALANSYNVPAVRLTESLGPAEVVNVLRKAGFDSLTRDPSHYGVGVVLGNGDVSLYELARAYRGLARGGVVGPLTTIRSANSAKGALRVQKEMLERRFLPEPAVALLTDILSDEGARAPAFGITNSLRLPFPVAVKTGTSRAFIDNWTVGFTRERTVAVWVGNFDGVPMRQVSGVTGAGPLFKRIMIRAMRSISPATLADRSRFDRADICPFSGMLAGPACPSVLHELFLPGTSPKDLAGVSQGELGGSLGNSRSQEQAPEAGRYCTMHRFDSVRAAKKGTRPQRVVLDVGPQFYGWAAAEGLAGGPWVDSNPNIGLPESRSLQIQSSRGPTETSPSGQLLSPGDGDEYLIDPGIPLEDQTIPVRALPPRDCSRLEVQTDEGESIILKPPFIGRIPAKRGVHQIHLKEPGSIKPIASAKYIVR